jgi:hypothetical protein
LQNLLDFWILHGSFGSCLLVFLTAAVEDGHLSFLDALLTQLILRINLKSSLKSFQCLVVFLQEKVAISFFGICLDVL